MTMIWKTRLTTMIRTSLGGNNNNNNHSSNNTKKKLIPIVGAPMAGHSGGKLAAAVCRAGGLGFIGVGHWLSSSAAAERNNLQEQIDIFRQEEALHKPETPYALNLGFICHSTFAKLEGWQRFEQVLQSHRPSVVQFTAPAVVTHETYNTSNVRLAQKYNAKVLAQVGTVQEAMEAVDAGVDGLIVQGSEAGGHGVRRELGNATLPLAITVITKLRAAGSEIPVIAAGGIVNGRGMAAMLVAGCDGVVLGTRLWASQESIGMQQFKDRLVAATSCDDVVRTTCFDWIQNTYSAAPWPEPFDSVGALRNQTSATWEGRADELALELQTKDSVLVADYRRACKEGNADIALVHAGEGVGLIDAIEPAYDIVTRISNEAADVIRNSPKQLLDE